jgi:hypothetical protein
MGRSLRSARGGYPRGETAVACLHNLWDNAIPAPRSPAAAFSAPTRRSSSPAIFTQAIDGFGNDDNNWMWGNNKANSMYGYDGMDQIKAGGGKGQDDLWAGQTPTRSGNFGHDSIHDFKAGGDLDTIELDHNQFADFNAVMSHAQQFGSNVQIKLDATHSIYIDNVNLADLHASDFSFG